MQNRSVGSCSVLVGRSRWDVTLVRSIDELEKRYNLRTLNSWGDRRIFASAGDGQTNGDSQPRVFRRFCRASSVTRRSNVSSEGLDAAEPSLSHVYERKTALGLSPLAAIWSWVSCLEVPSRIQLYWASTLRSRDLPTRTQSSYRRNDFACSTGTLLHFPKCCGITVWTLLSHS